MFPALIPISLLIHFNPGTRGQIAKGREATVDDTILLNRDDNGPPLRVWKGNTDIVTYYRDHGVVNKIKMDDRGFCNSTGLYKNSQIDIITLGDSFTWCTTVTPNQTWTSRLNGYMGISTYNLGMGGIGLYEYLQIFKKFGTSKFPKIVILNVYEGNDLRDADKYNQFLKQDLKSEKNGKNHSKPSIAHKIYESLSGSFLLSKSYVFNLMVASMKNLYSFIYSSLFLPPEVDFHYQLVFPEKTVPFNLENVDQNEVSYAKDLPGGKISFELFSNALKEFVQLSKRDHFIPIVTYTPSAHTAYRQFVHFKDSSLTNILNQFSLKQRNFFQSKAAELGFTFIDLTPSMQSATAVSKSQKLLYFPTNLHLSPYGHEIIAQAISEHLIKFPKISEFVSLEIKKNVDR